MNKKGSMELSVNSIVILVIAIVMLGLILGFVRSKFSQLDPKIADTEVNAPPASASTPLTISRSEIITKQPNEITLKFNAYASSDIPSIANLEFKCKVTHADGSIEMVNWVKDVNNGKAITAGTIGSFIVVLSVPASAPQGKQVCVASLNGKSIDVLVEVN